MSESRYPVALAIAVLALVPFIVVTSASELLQQQILRELGTNRTALSIVNNLAVAGYAFGALIGGDLIQRFRQRNLFFVCEALLALGGALASSAHGVALFGAGYVLDGVATGLLLVIALPPVIQSFPPAKLPVTAVAVDVGFFGGVTLGPLLGGALAAIDGWRGLFAGVAVVALAVLGTATVILPRRDPPDPGRPFDRAGITLGVLGTVLPFWGVGELAGHPFGSPLVWAPLAAGIACFVALLLVEFHSKEPISPVKPMWNTLPVAGVLVAAMGGGAYFTFFMLMAQFLLKVQHRTPLQAGLLFWPHVVGAMVAAVLLGVVLRTRYLAPFALFGMMAALAGGALFIDAIGTGSDSLLLGAGGLLGFGAGATVAPGLWFASLSLQSRMVGRIFALVELVRSLANFMLAPIVLAVALAVAGSATTPTVSGLRTASLSTLSLTAGLLLVGIAIFFGGGVGLQRPDLRRWLEEDAPAWESPELFSHARDVSKSRDHLARE